MEKQLNILWLPGWFPSRVDFLPGDFIERHARAVSELALVTVVYVIKDIQLPSKKTEIIKEQTGSLTIYRGYYSGKDGASIFNKINSVIHYYQLLFTIYKNIKKEKVNFDLCHVHVPIRQGLLAIFLKWKYNLNYVISEQNACYMGEGKNFFSQSFILRFLVKQSFKRSSAIHVVSKRLGEELIRTISIDRSYVVIPNVVNTEVFKLMVYKKQIDNNLTNFSVVTGDTFQKNTDGVIRAFSSFIHKGYKAKLHVVGPNIDELKLLAMDLEEETDIIFYGAVSNEDVAKITQQSDAMIFFTRYETFGCVMAEALCCGIPLIASRLPVLEENLIEGTNAMFVQSENENELTDKLSWFTGHKKEFNSVSIAREACKLYNYHSIALQFMDFYKTALER